MLKSENQIVALVATLVYISITIIFWGGYLFGESAGQIKVASGEYVCTELANGEWWCRPSEDKQ